MAVRGRRPTITMLRPLTAKNRRSRSGEPRPSGRPRRPTSFSKAHRELWDRYIEPSYWLAFVDTPKSIMFVNLLKRYLDDPEAMSVTYFRELRYLASDLGFDPPTRARMGDGADKPDSLSRFVD